MLVLPSHASAAVAVPGIGEKHQMEVKLCHLNINGCYIMKVVQDLMIPLVGYLSNWYDFAS